MPIPTKTLAKLQRKRSNIRNICILAHVDHGKTSISDCLLAGNGIISSTMAGTIRFLDSRPDEQLRGITMESSAVSLYFKIMKRPENDGDRPIADEYLVNLIDSPGHIDFSSEVSIASRICDGAVVVVDVVEGVCSQTITVLRQAWTEGLKPILVLNKIDRLVTELQYTPAEAYKYLSQLIEQVNAVIGSFFAGQRMEDDLKWREHLEAGETSADSKLNNEEFKEATDDDIYFTPESNNVVFASAIHGWGFNISQFAALYERKLGMKKEKLEKFLWGDFYYDAKKKSVSKKGKTPLFVQLVLEPIWALYQATIINHNSERVKKIVTSLGITLTEKDANTRDTLGLLKTIALQWIPLARAILFSAVEKLPSPIEAQKLRTEKILSSTTDFSSISESSKEAITNCDPTKQVEVFISKLVAYRDDEIPKLGESDVKVDKITEIREKARKARELMGGDSTDPSSYGVSADSSSGPESQTDEKMIGFARIFSGTISVGQALRLLEPRYSPAHPDEHVKIIKVESLFLLMGRSLAAVESVPAGNLVGIGGLDGKVVKTATLESVAGGPNFAATNTSSAPPILKVALEPEDPTKIPELEHGLELLNISDPCVEISIADNGEQILATAGELHLERCVKDLQERFAKIPIHVSQPMVPFRETIVTTGVSLGAGTSNAIIPGVGTLSFKVRPLPEDTVELLVKNEDKLRGLALLGRGKDDDLNLNCVIEKEELEKFRDELIQVLPDDVDIENLISFGPSKARPNILVDHTGSVSRRAFCLDGFQKVEKKDFAENILTGFQLAVSKGPLMAEPVQGLLCILERVDEEESEQKVLGRVITATRDAIHEAFLQWSPRILLSMYLCDIQATTEVLGKVYGVITKRRGKILSEDMKEGTPFFFIKALIPIIESFNLSEELRKRTSGAANPQLVYAGFRILDLDPFWVPTTEEELEEFGEFADKENIALKYVDKVRRQKGLPSTKKLVDGADKQRNLRKS